MFNKKGVTDTSLFLFIVFYGLFIFAFFIPAIGSSFSELEDDTYISFKGEAVTGFNEKFETREVGILDSFIRNNYRLLQYRQDTFFPGVDLNPDYDALFHFSSTRTYWSYLFGDLKYNYYLRIICSFNPLETTFEEVCPSYDNPSLYPLSDYLDFDFNPDYELLGSPLFYDGYFVANQNDFMTHYIQSFEEAGEEIDYDLLTNMNIFLQNFRQGINQLPATVNLLLFGSFVFLIGWLIARFIRGS